MMRFLPLLLQGLCAVFSLTLIRVLLLVCEEIMLRECKGDSNAGVRGGGGVVAVSAGCEYMRSTHGSGVIFSATDVLEMSVVRGMRGVGEYVKCIWLSRELSGREDWVCVLPILYAQMDCGTCVCVWVAVVLVSLGGFDQGGWVGVMYVL